MGANPHANGGLLLKDLSLPDFRSYAVPVAKPGTTLSEPTKVMGVFLRDAMKLNTKNRNIRIFGPDETASNRLGAVLEATNRAWMAQILPEDDKLSTDAGHGNIERAHLPGMARRISSDRQARFLFVL
jgi:xylulose-5-phosphate/fructose-6-phosphate phosphoketolase